MNVVSEFRNYEEAVSVVREALIAESGAQHAGGDIGLIICGDIDAHKQRSKRRREAVKKFAHDIGVAEPTLSMWMRVCRAVPKALRGEFPTLLFGHWRELSLVGGLTGEALRERAQEASDDETPVGVLHVKLKGAKGNPNVNIPRWLHRALKTAEKITPEDVQFAKGMHGEISQMAEHLEDELRGLRLAVGH